MMPNKPRELASPILVINRKFRHQGRDIKWIFVPGHEFHRQPTQFPHPRIDSIRHLRCRISFPILLPALISISSSRDESWSYITRRTGDRNMKIHRPLYNSDFSLYPLPFLPLSLLLLFRERRFFSFFFIITHRLLSFVTRRDQAHPSFGMSQKFCVIINRQILKLIFCATILFRHRLRHESKFLSFVVC